MTAEMLLLLLLCAATLMAASVGAFILVALGPAGWFVILALIVTLALVWRFAADALAARSDWARDDLRDDWRASS